MQDGLATLLSAEQCGALYSAVSECMQAYGTHQPELQGLGVDTTEVKYKHSSSISPQLLMTMHR